MAARSGLGSGVGAGHFAPFTSGAAQPPTKQSARPARLAVRSAVPRVSWE